MVPQNYNFYIGYRDKNIVLHKTSIDDYGQYIDNIDNVQAYSINTIKPGYMRVFISTFINTGAGQSNDNFSTIYFYDIDMNFISKVIISKNLIIYPPANAHYYSMRYAYYSVSAIDEKNKPLVGDEVCFINSIKPHYKDINKKYAKENGQEFFRVSLDGKISLFGKDYELIYNSKLEDQMIFIIDKYDNNSHKWREFYKGEFNKIDCRFNYDKKSCELKTTTIDGYSAIMNKYEDTYDLVKLAPEITKIKLNKRSLMQVYVRGANSITNFFGGTYWEDDVNEAIDSHNELISKYYFAYIKAGNEFYIKDANNLILNGVYAGTNGYWQNLNGYRCEYVKAKSKGDSALPVVGLVYDINTKSNRKPLVSAETFPKYEEDLYKLKIIQEKDNAVVYESEWLFYSSLPYIEDNIYINRNDIKLVNVNDANDTVSINTVFTYHIYRRLLCDVDYIEYSGGTKNTYDIPLDDFVTDSRNYKKCIGLTGGLFFCTSRVVDEATKYGVNDDGKYFTNRFISSTTGLGEPLPISRNSWANASLWYVYDTSYELFEQRLRKQYTLKDSWSIAAVIKALLSKIDPTLMHEANEKYSNFLYGYNMPINADRFYVYITQKTNILKGNYDQPAQKAEISLEEIMKMLRDCFRCYWYIENNRLKIEHVSFFMNGGSYIQNASIQFDFTKLKDQFNKKELSYFQSEVEYDKSDLNQRYEFNWMDDVTDLFGGVTIDVKSSYIQKDKTEEINVNQFSSDIDYMLFNPSSFSNDGFALLCPIKNGSSLEIPIIKTQLKNENGNTYNAIIQNFYASWVYLIKFYMYDMPATNIECNMLDNIYVRDIKMCMKHTIELITEKDINELELIKTSIGEGKIDEISTSMNTCLSKIKLSYRPK